MAPGTEAAPVSSLEKGDGLHQRVLASFPLCDLREEDLVQNPRFCELLAALAQHLDETGLSVPLKAELEEAEKKLQSVRRRWLRSEVLHTGLQEMIQNHCIRKQEATVPPHQNMFYETLENSLHVTECVRLLDLSDTTDQDQNTPPPLLGLNPELMTGLTKPVNVERMKGGAPAELEKHLKKKCLSLLAYHQPDSEPESESLRLSRLSHLSAQLEQEKSRAEGLKDACRQNTLVLQKQTDLYLSELMRGSQLLQALVLDHRLVAQPQVENMKLDYHEGKCELILEKIVSQMVETQLETYTKDSITAHMKIRAKLDSELKACRLEKQSLESKLASFEILGEGFKAQAEQYCKLRKEIETKVWAMKKITQYSYE